MSLLGGHGSLMAGKILQGWEASCRQRSKAKQSRCPGFRLGLQQFPFAGCWASHSALLRLASLIWFGDGDTCLGGRSCWAPAWLLRWAEPPTCPGNRCGPPGGRPPAWPRLAFPLSSLWSQPGRGAISTAHSLSLAVLGLQPDLSISVNPPSIDKKLQKFLKSSAYVLTLENALKVDLGELRAKKSVDGR